MQKLLRPEAAVFPVAPRLGEQLPRDDERWRSIAANYHQDDTGEPIQTDAEQPKSS
jgi:hypothetical protein